MNLNARKFFIIISCNLIVTFLIYVHFQSLIEHLREQNKRLDRVVRDLQLSAQEELSSIKSSGYDIKDQVVIYNRLPKTGSTSFLDIIYNLCSPNEFHSIYVNASKNYVFSVPDQLRFVANVSNWETRKPSFYHGHFAYIDFTKHGVLRQPIYINVVREPLERLASYYYFLRYGDDYRPHLRRSRMGDTTTFDECVEEGGHDCSEEKLWIQIPFFCGQAHFCWEPGSTAAFEAAKNNLVNKYLLVGTTESLSSFVATLELSLPHLFHGAYDLFTADGGMHKRKTRKKSELTSKTIAHFKKSKIYQIEREFYDFAVEQFHWVQRKLYRQTSSGKSYPLSQQFHYQKVRPRNVQEL